MIDATPVFRSTSQALHFAFLIEAYEVGVESVMAKAIRRLMKENGIWDDNEPSTVDFGVLDALEVRAQCAMIRAVVKDRLPGPERWAIQARYGINDPVIKDGKIVTENGRKKYRFSRERRAAVLNLGRWLMPSLPGYPRLAVCCLVARAVDKRVCDVSYRDMAEKMGSSKDTWARAQKRVLKRLQELENMAIDRLDPAFIADGLVEMRQ